MPKDFNVNLPKTIALERNESVVLATRPHWLVPVSSFVVLVVVFLVPFFFLWPLFRLGRVGLAVFVFLVLFAGTLMFREYYRWHRTLLVLTTSRLFYIVQRGFFDLIVTEVPYHSIQDIMHRITGIWPTIFGYGSLELRVIGAASTLELARLPRPDRLHQLILEYRGQPPETPAARPATWWESRWATMTEAERAVVFNRIRRFVGDDAWQNFFRPEGEEPTRPRAADVKSFFDEAGKV